MKDLIKISLTEDGDLFCERLSDSELANNLMNLLLKIVDNEDFIIEEINGKKLNNLEK